MRKNIAKILFGVAIVMILVILGSLDKADAAGAQFSVSFIPSYPEPGDRTMASIKSYNFDTDRAVVIWKLDGEIIAGGTGKRTTSFKWPDFGKDKLLTVFVTTIDDEESSQSIPLVGNDTDLLWEALTSVPVGYKGKALPTTQSEVKITPIPYLFLDGSVIPASQLVYEWFLNFKKDMGASGLGKNSFVFQIKKRKNYDVILKVSNREGEIFFEKSMTLPAGLAEPEVVFYKDSPLEGPAYNSAIGKIFDLPAGVEDVSVRAEPYFFSIPSNNSQLSFDWQINNKETTTDNPNMINLRVDPNVGTGQALIRLAVRHSRKVFQSGMSDFIINFGI